MINCIFNAKISKMYSVTINKEKFTVEKPEEMFAVDGKQVDWDLVRISDRLYHLLVNHVSYTVELINIDAAEKEITIKLNNKTGTIKIQDKFDLLLDKLGMDTSTRLEIMDVKAPMPGLILDIKVQVGDKVKKGEPLLVLEAMKMENIIKSVSEGEVKSILVAAGNSVEKNQVLIHF